MKSSILQFVADKTKNIRTAPYEGYVNVSFTDIHCHCLPFLDDGPLTMNESIILCRALAKEGIETVIATPHQLGRFENQNCAEKIRESVKKLNGVLHKNNISLKVVPGSEVRIDERICELIEADRVMTLADGNKYILLELPFKTFINIEPLIKELNSMGIRSIISHVERIEPLVAQPGVLLKWLEHSVYLQITASSLLGDFGLKIQKAAWNFLDSGWVSFVATDSHDVDFRRPRMKDAFNIIRKKSGEGIARLVCIENPERVVNGEIIEPVCVWLQKQEINLWQQIETI